MKKILFIILVIAISFCGCSNQQNTNIEPQTTVVNNQGYVKSVWITYYELNSLIGNKTADEFEKDINTAFKQLYDMGFNTVTVQVRPCADAFYMSNYFPSSKYCFGQQGSQMLYDPLKIICSAAQQNDLKIEAWINPYRVSQDSDVDALCETNIAKIWLNNEDKKSNVYIAENGIYFNPSSSDVTELIVNGVKEIVSNYNVDAIHFDDYFYPTTDTVIDAVQYQQYINDNGNLSLADWRRENVSQMVKSVYDAIKQTNENVLFGISPSANIESNYSKLYADTVKWASEEGYVDYICPQVYYGFKNETQPFMFTTKRWISLCEKDLYIGLPLYKTGKADEYASQTDTTAINEFIDNNNVISRQISYIGKLSKIKGFYIFSYSNLFDESCKTEVENMLNIMQSSSQD